MNPTENAQDLSELRSSAKRCQACFEVWPAWSVASGPRRQVGFEVDLCGGVEQPAAGARTAMYNELKRIAESVLPGDMGDVRVDVMPFDNSFHESPRRGFRPEVVVEIEITHSRAFEQPANAAEERCLRELEKGLAQLGVRRVN